jgi:hypothetical protein
MKRTILTLLLSISVNAMEETALAPSAITHTTRFEELKNRIVHKVRQDKTNNDNKVSIFDHESLSTLGASDTDNRPWIGLRISDIQQMQKWTDTEKDSLFQGVNNIIEPNQNLRPNLQLFALFSQDPRATVEFLKKILGEKFFNKLNVFHHYAAGIKQSWNNKQIVFYHGNPSIMQKYFLDQCMGLFKQSQLSLLYLPLNLNSMCITPQTSGIEEFIKNNYESLSKKMREESRLKENRSNCDAAQGLFDFEYFVSRFWVTKIATEGKSFLNLLKTSMRAKNAQHKNETYAEYFLEDLAIKQAEQIDCLMCFVDCMFATQIRTEEEILKYAEFKGGWERIPDRILEKLILFFDEEGLPVPECLKGRVSEDIAKLKAITFIEDMAHLTEEESTLALQKQELTKIESFKEEKIEELPLVPQYQAPAQKELLEEHVLLPEIPRKDFSSLKKDFVNLFEKKDYETIEYLAQSDFPLMRHILSWFVKEQENLLKKSPTYISEIITKKNHIYQQKEDNKPGKKSKKSKETIEEKAEKASQFIRNRNHKNKTYQVLEKDYRSQNWYINKKNIKWQVLSKELAQLGAFTRDEKGKHKITFYIAGTEDEPVLVTQEEYNVLDGREKFKHEITLTSHFNHENSEILDLGFLDDVFKILQALTK